MFASLNVLTHNPLIGFGFVLAVFWYISRFFRSEWTARLSVGSITVITAAVWIAAASYLLLYLNYPSFEEHIEPNIAIVSYLFTGDKPVYHDLDSGALYAFLYGPMPYLGNALTYWLFGPSVFASKLTGILCFLTAGALSGLTVHKLDYRKAHLIAAALAYFAVTALFFRNHSFWNKPDSYMLMFAALGVFSCVMRRGPWSAIICGLAMAGMTNGKLHGAALFLPLVIWQFQTHGWKQLAWIAGSFVICVLAPFILFSGISLANYLQMLQLAAAHGLDTGLFVHALQTSIFMGLPLLLFILSGPGIDAALVWTKNHRLLSLSCAGAVLSALIVASKPGSGAHQLLPFVPVMSVLFSVSLFEFEKSFPNASSKRYWIPLSAFALVAILKASLTLYQGISISAKAERAHAIVADIASIRESYPDHSINMGYGDGSRYIDTWLRPHLVFTGQPYFIDASAIMDLQFSGVQISPNSYLYVNQPEKSIWLIPKGTEPFSMVNWYLRDGQGQLFDEDFQDNFYGNFSKLGYSDYFDLWFRRPTAPADHNEPREMEIF